MDAYDVIALAFPFLSIPITDVLALGDLPRPVRRAVWVRTGAVLAGAELPGLAFALMLGPGTDAGGLAALPALAVGVGSVWLAVSNRRKRIVARAILDPSTRDAAVVELRGCVEVERARYADGSWCGRVLDVAPALAAASLHDVLEELLACDPPPVAPTIAAGHAFWLAAVRIRRNDGPAARRALATAPKPAPSEWQRELAWIEAYVDAADGAPDAALAAATASHEPAWALVRAHAFAAKGERERAHEELRVLRTSAPDLLSRVRGTELPAAALARSLARAEHPFR